MSNQTAISTVILAHSSLGMFNALLLKVLVQPFWHLPFRRRNSPEGFMTFNW